MNFMKYKNQFIIYISMEKSRRTRDNNSSRLKSKLQPSSRYEDRKTRPKLEDRAHQTHEKQLKRPADTPIETVAKESKKADTVTPEEPKDNDNYYELSPLMNAMVEEELNDLMINVWKNLPDDAPNEAEKLVLEKFKDIVGNDLRQTLGLNITKRLLNVNNVLRVKFIIPVNVLSTELEEFEKKNRIIDLKLITKTTYAGRMRNWADYDQIISAKNLTCGDYKVTASPVYRFLHCPPNLRTVFDGKHDLSHEKALENEARKINTAKELKKVDKDSKNNPKIAENNHNTEIKLEKTVSAKPANKKSPNNTLNKEYSAHHVKSERAKTAAAIISPTNKHEIQLESAENKLPTLKTDVNKQQEPNKTVNKHSVKQQQAVVNYPPRGNQETKQLLPTNTGVNKPTSRATPNKPQPNSIAKGTVKTKTNETTTEGKSVKQEPCKDLNKTPIKKVAQKINATKTVTNPKLPQKVEVKSVVSSKAITKKAKPKKNDDFDELDDHDILAMLSGGIVLDECSGSED